MLATGFPLLSTFVVPSSFNSCGWNIFAISFAVYGALFVVVTGAPVGVPSSVAGVPSGFFTLPGVVPFGSTTCFKLLPTLLNTVGLFVFSSPLFIDALTLFFCTSSIGFSSVAGFPAPSTTFPAPLTLDPTGYTLSPITTDPAGYKFPLCETTPVGTAALL